MMRCHGLLLSYNDPYKTTLMSWLRTHFIFNVDFVATCQRFRRAQAQDDDDDNADHEPGGNNRTSQVERRRRGRDKLRQYRENQHNEWYQRHNDMPQDIENFTVLA